MKKEIDKNRKRDLIIIENIKKQRKKFFQVNRLIVKCYSYFKWYKEQFPPKRVRTMVIVSTKLTIIPLHQNKKNFGEIILTGF